jgi:iron complex outermembrane receptor protein
MVLLTARTSLLAQTPAISPTPTQQPIQPVTTTIEVQGHVADDYMPTALSVGSLDGLPLLQAPVSATVVTRDLMTDQFTRVLSDVVKNDASVGEDYAPVGYYGDFEIRGFPIDLATGLQINGMVIAGEQDVPLENKERVEFLKGIAGLESGITTAGGLINYVTKRPALVKTFEAATDHRGTAFGALDLGRILGAVKQAGVRGNLAGEEIKSYVKDANGWRAVGAAAFDWKATPTTQLQGDFEFQHKTERSVSGYQLLGGTSVPDVSKVYPSVMLGEQSWSKPNIFDVFNAGLRVDQNLHKDWKSFGSASLSHSSIDDNVVYAYGCYYEALCQGNGGSAPDYFFAPDGGYDIYDYRDPNELRIDAQVEGIVSGHLKTGVIEQDVTGGGSVFRRSVQQPSAAVYNYVGSENIYQPTAAVPIDVDPGTGLPYKAGPQVLYEDSHQAAGIVQDRVHLPGRIQLLAGGRFDSLRDHNYSGNLNTNKSLWLPQYAATYNPLSTLTFYGNYSVMLSLGPQAPFWTTNGSQFLAPYFTRQAEVGAKFEPGQRILLTTALFRTRAPFFYPKVDPADPTGASLIFLSEGHELHNGIEFGAQGKAANWLRLSATAAAISAKSQDTGTASFENRQVINVPHLRTTVFADISVPRMKILRDGDFHIMPGWSYTGRKEATRDDATSVPEYNLFNLGARYSPKGEQGRSSYRFYADNLFDKRYWKDTGANYGDTFVHLGAPATVRLSAQYRF